MVLKELTEKQVKRFRSPTMNFFRCMCSRPPRPTPKATTHYDSLGIPQNSTQGEVKAAYYKLSMLFHPDKNPGDSEAAGKFRDISEAYEVLGNTRTRKLYDKGLLIRIPRYKTDSRVHPQRNQPRAAYSPPSSPFSTPVYDFDEWARSHYGATFRRQMENRKRSEEYKESRRQVVDEGKAEKTTFMLLLLFGIGYNIILMYGMKKHFASLENPENEKRRK